MTIQLKKYMCVFLKSITAYWRYFTNFELQKNLQVTTMYYIYFRLSPAVLNTVRKMCGCSV